ncbi:MAG: cytochrome d ubiquinol oxidase subunit II [Bacteroidales bacterium]|nr:cytochrome d ubiquinol oxidase subunit II [Bacteroidales bacterium]
MGLINKAIAPIWEANHVWLILIIVVLFVGFPPVYSNHNAFAAYPGAHFAARHYFEGLFIYISQL